MKDNTSGIRKFGTFLGVFTPSALTILGLIMYLRFGWVLSNTGLGYTLLIVLIASSITLITGLSASAIATNMHVGAGGEYYMVSRSLGIELGGAIGIPLYFCRTLSVTFYCFGMAEAVLLFFPDALGFLPGNPVQTMAALIIILITLLSGKSAGLVLKFQIPILILVVLSVIALVAGVLTGPVQSPDFDARYETASGGFWYVFAVFFPAVTGFTAGIGMSGDLRDPKKSIPVGTIGAILACLAVYIIVPVAMAFSASVSVSELGDAERGVQNWIDMALLGALIITPAVLGAILSSAFGSILNGPRVLQALSKDGLAPEVFSRLSKTGQPAFATWITGAIALIAVLLGGLNTVAILVSVLFLTLYVAINLSAVTEVLVAEPHYRPTIRVPWWISLAGAAGAIFVMFLISPWACLIAIVLEIALYTYLSKKSLEQKWGDVVTGVLLNISKRALLNHSKRPSNPRNWRPIILLFSSDIRAREPLVRLGAAIAESKGVLTICQMVDIAQYRSYNDLDRKKTEMQDILEDFGVEAFCEVIVVKDLNVGSLEIAKAHGLAGLKCNTIMEGLSVNEELRALQIDKLRSMAEYGKNIIYSRVNRRSVSGVEQKILIWWGGRERNGDLMLLLAYLIQLNPDYRDHRIEVNSIVSTSSQKIAAEKDIESQLKGARIEASVNVMMAESGPWKLIMNRSRNVDIVMIGLPLSGSKNSHELADWAGTLSDNNLTTLFVYNAGMADAIPRLLK